MRYSAKKMDGSSATVGSLPWAGDDAALVDALGRGDPGAPALLYDRHAVRIRRVLARVLGPDGEMEDVLHEVFAQAFASLDGIEDPQRLEAWLTRVAVFTARGWIRRRGRRRWLHYFSPDDLPSQATRDDHEGRDAMRRTYAVLERLSTDERIVFALRFIEQMELTEVADACDVSLATVKRRIAKARASFESLAARDPVLRERLERGGSR